jgi:DNA-binding PadR family transcriptional regulator
MTETDSPTDQSQRCPGHWYQCTGFQRDILLSIASHCHFGHEPYGLALHEWLNKRYPQAVNTSRVYTNLDDLYERGLVKRERLSERENAYRLTEAGKECLAAHGRLVNVLDLPEMMPAQAIE